MNRGGIRALLPASLLACGGTIGAAVDGGPREAGADVSFADVTPPPPDAGVDARISDVLVEAPSDVVDASFADAADSSGAFTSSYPGDYMEGETHLAVGTNGFVAAAWIAFTGSRLYIGYTFSTDSGSTWTPVDPIYAPVGSTYALDPSIAVDAANNFYVSFLAANVLANGSTTAWHVYVAAARVGTTTFGTPFEVTDPAEGAPIDGGPALYAYSRPWIAVTKSQEIVVSYTRTDSQGCWPNRATPGCANIVLGRSTNGTSWTRVPVTANDAGSDAGDGGVAHFPDVGFPCVSATTGRLWVVYDDGDLSLHDFRVMLQYSDDDGATWSSANTTVIATFTGTNLPNPAGCAGSGDDVWVGYELLSGVNLPQAISIQVVHSINGGQTFGAPVNTLDTTASAAAWNAQLALESSGDLDVEYYGGAAEGDPNGSVYYVHSSDKGATWGPATVIKTPIRLITLPYGNTNGWLGDYLGVSTAGGSLYTTFADNSAGFSHIDFAKQTLP